MTTDPQSAAAQLPRLAYSPGEAAEVVGLSKRRLYEELTSGRLRSVRVGARRLIPANALEEWLESLPQSEGFG